MEKSTKRKAMRTRTAKPKRNWVLYVLVLSVTLYVLFMIVDQQIKIMNANAELAVLDEKIYAQEQTNAELKKVADAVEKEDEKAFEGYIEKIAREEMDYVKNGEVVFVNTAGD